VNHQQHHDAGGEQSLCAGTDDSLRVFMFWEFFLLFIFLYACCSRENQTALADAGRYTFFICQLFLSVLCCFHMSVPNEAVSNKQYHTEVFAVYDFS